MSDKLMDACAEMSRLQLTLEALEAEAKTVKEKIRNLAEQVVPHMMMESEIERIDTHTHTVTLDYYFMGGLPEAGTEAYSKAMQYLENEDAMSLWKAKVVHEFPRDSFEEAREFAKETDGKLTAGVHPSTLKAWAKERLRNDEPVDLETIGLHGGMQARLKKRVK